MYIYIYTHIDIVGFTWDRRLQRVRGFMVLECRAMRGFGVQGSGLKSFCVGLEVGGLAVSNTAFSLSHLHGGSY